MTRDLFGLKLFVQVQKQAFYCVANVRYFKIVIL
jgi:hypothetical protein